LRKHTIERKLDFLNAQRESMRNWSEEWCQSIERSDVMHSPSDAFTRRGQFPFGKMRYVLYLIQLGGQRKSIQKPFNKGPGALIVRRGKKKLTTWIRHFVE